jgi:hypothetical protein
MSNEPRDRFGQFVWGCLILYWLINNTRLGDYPLLALLATVLLFGVGKATVRMVQSAIARLGSARAWSLTLQLTGWFAAFIALVPFDPVAKALIVWGIGLPLTMAGAILRNLRERLEGFDEAFFHAMQVAAVLAVLSQVGVLWRESFDLWNSLKGTFLFTALAAVPLFYGWQLGEPFPKGGASDARFGSAQDFHKAGMSDEY